MFNFIKRIIEIVKRFLLDQPEQDNLQELTSIEPFQQLQTEVSELDRCEQKSAADLKVREVSPQLGNATLQQQIDSLEDGATLQLWSAGGEYKGPIVINHPLSFDGQGATIWALSGPVLSIESERVRLSNLRIEVTAEEAATSPEEKSAILLKSAAKLQFDNVEVRGLVMGIPEEEGEWRYPNSLHLGQLAHGQEHNLLLRIVVPVACKIAANISGLEFSPRHLTPGANEIQICIEELPKDTLINGSIFLVSASLKRRISLTAHILSLPDKQARATQSIVVWQPEDWESIVHSSEPEPIEKKSDQVSPENQGNVEVIPRYPQSPGSPSKIRLVRSQPLNPSLFDHKPSPSKSLEQQEQMPASERTERSQTINPLFEQKPSPKESAKQQQNAPAEKSSEASQLINPLFESNSASKPLDKPNQVAGSETSGRSQPINPLFEQKSSPEETVNQQQKTSAKNSSGSSQLINPLFESNSASKPLEEQNNITAPDHSE